MKNYLNMVNSFIQFSLSEYSIFKKYNQFIITLSCLLIGISSDFDEELNEEESQKNRNLLKNYFKEFNFLNLSIIEECEKEILFIINNNSDEDEEDFKITRPNSLNSLLELLNNSEKLKENKNENSYRFSTASNEDFIGDESFEN